MCVTHISADPGPSHGRGGAWGHLWCGPCLAFLDLCPDCFHGHSIPLALRDTTSIVPLRHCRPGPTEPSAAAPLLYRSETAGHTPPWAYRTLQGPRGSTSILYTWRLGGGYKYDILGTYGAYSMSLSGLTGTALSALT